MAASLWIVLVVASVVTGVTSRDYSGHQVLRIIPRNDDAIKDLEAYVSASGKLDVWRRSNSRENATDVMVHPDSLTSFKQMLNNGGYNVRVMIQDVQALIENKSLGRNDELDNGHFNWMRYHTLDSMYAWLKQKAMVYGRIAKVISAGVSHEGRPILGLRIAHKPNLPIVVVEAGIHAREWVAPATATWFIREALSGKDPTIASYEWHVFPSVNPDGYVYTQKDRLWRKSRRFISQTSDKIDCYGVDINRNWPFEWRQADSDPCSETYPGDKANSEVESQAVTSYLKSVANRTRVYIALHSYGQLLMYPWAYTTDLPANAARLHEIAKKAEERIAKLYNTHYTYGSIAKTIYQAYGSTLDFAASLKIPYSFAFELRDNGDHGFLLPPKYILSTATEAMEGVTAILEEANKH